ncbi:gephyrin-like molybdotransferase Glp [Candidatus Eisenbacteria bacterium]|uniref:Molybdopterin molybdenumtransferase n=1 Tax=Eiseniibacteriota bacterium TaxID=2212470 RepID=A0ABV6YMZ7_UNCEI
MTSPEDAWDLILSVSKPLPAVHLDLAAALDHVLVSPVRADRDMPPADRSTRDGYALRSADLGSQPAVLRVLGEIPAGSPAAPSVGQGECVRIFTGANLPEGADTVVMVEDTGPEQSEVAGIELVRIVRPPEKGANVSLKGEIARDGDRLLAAGVRLGAMATAACAAAGLVSVEVHRRPTVSVLVTGAELREGSHEVQSHEIRNSNGPMLAAALRLQGYEVASSSYVTDQTEFIAGYLQAALERSDVVVMTGGTSVGKYDLVADAIGSVGGTIRFRGLDITPGKPTLFATTGDGRYIFGLPGNPLGAMTGFYEAVLPLLRRLAGWHVASCRPSLQVRLAEEIAGKKGRQHHVLGRLKAGAGGLTAEIVKGSGAADFAAGSRADGTIIVPPDTGKLAAGSICEFRMWK